MSTENQNVRVLMLDARVITPERDGASLRCWEWLKIMVSMGLQVDFLPFCADSFPPFEESLEADTQKLAATGVRVVPRDTTWKEYLEANQGAYDIVILVWAIVAIQVIEEVERTQPQALLVFDTVDLEHVRRFREAKLKKNAKLLQYAMMSKKAALNITKRCHCTLLVSEEERQVWAEDNPDARLRVLPSIHELDREGPPFDQRADLLYIGSFVATSNEDAVLYFCESIFPHILAEVPDMVFRIVGGPVPESIQALASPNIRVMGYVDDLVELYRQCRLSVTPLRFGAGIKLKVLNSLAHAVPVVGSSVAAEGLGATHGKEMLILEDPLEFARGVVDLYQDRDRWERMSRAGLELVDARFSTGAIRQQWESLLQELLEIPRQRS